LEDEETEIDDKFDTALRVITFRLPEILIERIHILIEKGIFSDFSEFVRFSIKKALKKFQDLGFISGNIDQLFEQRRIIKRAPRHRKGTSGNITHPGVSFELNRIRKTGAEVEIKHNNKTVTDVIAITQKGRFRVKRVEKNEFLIFKDGEWLGSKPTLPKALRYVADILYGIKRKKSRRSRRRIAEEYMQEIAKTVIHES